MKSFCCFERVVSILKICLDCGSCLSPNISFIIQIFTACIRRSDTLISEMVSKSYKRSFLKFVFHKTAGIPAFVYS